MTPDESSSAATTQPEKLDLHSLDVSEAKRAELLRLFPEARTEEGKIDFERLKLALGETVDVGRERYGMTWPGKAECFKTIQSPSLATLLPDREQSVNFDTTENLIIEGDNLEVLKLLQKSYLGKVKMIYIDPPYNTGNDFIYPDNFSESLQTYLQYTGQVDAEGKKFSTNTETDGRFHSKWMNMMYPRLYLARNLLRDDGVIFVSIDDHEVAALRRLCDEIFGEENFIAQFVWHTEGHTDNQFDVKVNHEYVVMYSRMHRQATLGHVVDPNTREESNLWKGYAENSITKNGPGNPPSEVLLPPGFPAALDAFELMESDIVSEFYELTSLNRFISRELTDRFHATYPVRLDAMVVRDGRLTEPCRVFSGWANLNKLRAFIANDFQPLDEDGDRLSFYLSERGVIYYRRDRDRARNILSVLRNMGTTERMRSDLEDLGIPFSYPKPLELLQYLQQVGGEDGIILDFFAGSGTTAEAALRLASAMGSRPFILVQLPELTYREDFKTVADITKERVRRVITKIDEEESGKLDLQGVAKDRGFRVFKLSESNFKTWNADAAKSAESVTQQLELHVDHVRAGRSEEDLLFEILITSGYPLTARVETLTLEGKNVFSAADGALLVCLERELTLEVVRAIAARRPERVICLDEAFRGNDQLKANAVQIFKTLHRRTGEGELSSDVTVFRTV